MSAFISKSENGLFSDVVQAPYLEIKLLKRDKHPLFYFYQNVPGVETWIPTDPEVFHAHKLMR